MRLYDDVLSKFKRRQSTFNQGCKKLQKSQVDLSTAYSTVIVDAQNKLAYCKHGKVTKSHIGTWLLLISEESNGLLW